MYQNKIDKMLCYNILLNFSYRLFACNLELNDKGVTTVLYVKSW
jgi:hypothetical protein